MCVPTLCLSIYLCMFVFFGYTASGRGPAYNRYVFDQGFRHTATLVVQEGSRVPPRRLVAARALCLLPRRFDGWSATKGRGMSWEKKDDPNKNTQKVKTYPPCECEFWLIDANFLTLGRIHGGLGYVYIYIYINTKIFPIIVGHMIWTYGLKVS